MPTVYSLKYYQSENYGSNLVIVLEKVVVLELQSDRIYFTSNIQLTASRSFSNWPKIS